MDTDSETPQNRDLLAVCGLYCGACYHYRAGQPDGAHLLVERARGGRPRQGYLCDGCRSGQRYAHPNCAACELRRCADEHGVRHCGECDEFPCQTLLNFRNDGREHHVDVLDQLRARTERGVDLWLEAQVRRWACPQCGTPFSWYERTCHACGSDLASYGEGEPVDGDLTS